METNQYCSICMIFLNNLMTKLFGKNSTIEKTEPLDGIELANDIMLKDIYTFLLEKGFYGNENFFSKIKAQKDIFQKDGMLRKRLDDAGIKTRYDLALTVKDGDLYSFGPYCRIMKLYRNTVIIKSFQHRLEECM